MTTTVIPASELKVGHVLVTRTRTGSETDRTVTAVEHHDGEVAYTTDRDQHLPGMWTIPADWSVRVR